MISWFRQIVILLGLWMTLPGCSVSSTESVTLKGLEQSATPHTSVTSAYIYFSLGRPPRFDKEGRLTGLDFFACTQRLPLPESSVCSVVAGEHISSSSFAKPNGEMRFHWSKTDPEHAAPDLVESSVKFYDANSSVESDEPFSLNGIPQVTARHSESWFEPSVTKVAYTLSPNAAGVLRSSRSMSRNQNNDAPLFNLVDIGFRQYIAKSHTDRPVGQASVEFGSGFSKVSKLDLGLYGPRRLTVTKATSIDNGLAQRWVFGETSAVIVANDPADNGSASDAIGISVHLWFDDPTYRVARKRLPESFPAEPTDRLLVVRAMIEAPAAIELSSDDLKTIFSPIIQIVGLRESTFRQVL